MEVWHKGKGSGAGECYAVLKPVEQLLYVKPLPDKERSVGHDKGKS